MEKGFWESENEAFDSEKYLRILMAIAKADPDNGPHEFNYVRGIADQLGLDFQTVYDTTDKSYTIKKNNVSKLTALVILKDAIMLASLDRNFSLPERQRVYTYAEKLDIARSIVDELEILVNDYLNLKRRWIQLVKS